MVPSRSEEGRLGSWAASVCISALQPISCETLDKSLNLSESLSKPRFPQTPNADYDSSLGCGAEYVRWNARESLGIEPPMYQNPKRDGYCTFSALRHLNGKINPSAPAD